MLELLGQATYAIANTIAVIALAATALWAVIEVWFRYRHARDENRTSLGDVDPNNDHSRQDVN